MVDDITTPLVLSIVSLAATIITTLVGAYITYYSDERKARREANKILLKYRDPLLLAAADLQSRCFGICDEEQDLLAFRDLDAKRETTDVYSDNLYIYTAYVIGQYLSWSWILRRQAQFVALVSSNPPSAWRFSARTHATATSSLMQKINDIKAVFAHDGVKEEKAFMLFKADQQIIGEIMSCQDKNGEYYCMGYATFVDRWKNGAPDNLHDSGVHRAADVVESNHDEKMAGISKLSDQRFRAHFKVIEEGIDYMYDQRKNYKTCQDKRNLLPNLGADGRLRRLQHLLLDLMLHLDTSGIVQTHDQATPVRPAAPGCRCSLHPCHCKDTCHKCIRTSRVRSAFIRGIQCPCADETCHTYCECKHCEDAREKKAHTRNVSSSVSSARDHRAHSSGANEGARRPYSGNHEENGNQV